MKNTYKKRCWSKKILLAVAVVAIMGCEKKVDNYDVDLNRETKELYYKDSDKLVTGRVSFNFFDVKVQSIGFKDGIHHGKYIEKYRNGWNKSEKSYNMGILDGDYKEYYKEIIIDYRSAKRDNKKNQLKINGSYKNGKKNGKFVEYFRNGKVNRKCLYVEDKKNGKEVIYYPGGDRVWMKKEWKRGRLMKTVKYNMYGDVIKHR